MIIESILSMVFNLITIPLSLLPNIPQVPDSFYTSVNSVLDTIFNNLGLIGVFVRPATLQIIIPLFLIVINFDYIYSFVMFILRKLHIIG